VVLIERIGDDELTFEELETGLGHLEQVLGIEMFEQRGSAVEAQGHDGAVRGGQLRMDRAVGAGDDRGDIGRDRRRRRELPHGRRWHLPLTELGEGLSRVARSRCGGGWEDGARVGGADGEGGWGPGCWLVDYME